MNNKSYFRKIALRLFFAILLLLQLTHSSYASSLKQILLNAKIPELKVNVINTYPHNNNNFTEGIQFDDSGLYYYESSGLQKKSKLQKIELTTAKILQQYNLPSKYFAEGITHLNNKIYQLTYTNQLGFIYDKDSFKLLGTFNYSGQGWGLTNNNQELIMSNGSSTLKFISLEDFTTTKTINVTAGGQSISKLNELEYINGKIYSNVWYSTIILIISPETGFVEQWFDIAPLKSASGCSSFDCVANGILYNHTDSQLFVTGKYWRYIFNISLSK